VVVVECPMIKEHGKVVDGWMAGESGGRRKKGAGWTVTGCWAVAGWHSVLMAYAPVYAMPNWGQGLGLDASGLE
jgi:hypothetical protein